MTEERKSEILLRELKSHTTTVDHLLKAAYSLVSLRLGRSDVATGLLYEASQLFSPKVLGRLQDLEFALRDERKNEGSLALSELRTSA